MLCLPFDIYPVMRPILFRLDPELAHGLAIFSLKAGVFPAPKVPKDPIFNTSFAGMALEHPVGFAAGFDKQAEVVRQLFDLGFSFIEVGGVTPRPQKGNPKPRMFRIPESKALINRFNLNSIGFDAFAERLKRLFEKTKQGKLPLSFGVNIARGDNCADDAEAYAAGLRKFAPYVRFATINISCPNEPNACNLQGKDQLRSLLARIKKTHDALPVKPLLLVKISPDQTEQQMRDIAEVVLNSGIDGMIIGNTTATRPASITSPVAKERGGLSGKPLFEMSTKVLGTMYKLTEGKVPIIGCGGIFSGADAYAKIRAGASLVQVYTGMVYEGPWIVARILDDLAALLRRDGFASVEQAVGADFGRS